ncbi:hypothetical protein EV426DRAFT_703503 [Tirmania nivea]|nr:hypothetical protein EV426DRAFT_703503 [Tirmania nivea]
MWNFGLGRPNEDNKLAEQVPKPTPTDETEKRSGILTLAVPPSLPFNQLASITQGITAWRDNLPELFKSVKCGDLPILFYLNEFHRTIDLALFRPFVALSFEPGQNFLSPRQLTDMYAPPGVSATVMGCFTNSLFPCAMRGNSSSHPKARADYQFGVFGMKETGAGWRFGRIALLSMAEIKDLPDEKKKPTEELEHRYAQ